MNDRLRIVHCFRSPVGGIFRHVRDLAEAQRNQGHEVGIVCDSTTGGSYEDKLFETVAPTFSLGIHRTPMQRHLGPGDIAAAWRSYALIRDLKPDILHGHGAKGGAYARLFGTLIRRSGRRAARLYSPHGGSLHYDSDTATGRIFFLLEKAMDRFTDRFLFVSRYEYDTFRDKIGEPRAPWTLVYNGLKPAEFEPVANTADAADFLYIGMMRDLKGPDLFIDALALASRDMDRPLTAVMVGDGDDLPKYRAQASRLGLGEHIRFHPAMPARQAFALGRIVVVPSRAEAMPYIVLEALAARKPMIATAVGGIPEIFGPASPALAAPNAGEIAGRMIAALSDERSYAGAMPSTGDLKARFSVEVMARSVSHAYADSLKSS